MGSIPRIVSRALVVVDLSAPVMQLGAGRLFSGLPPHEGSIQHSRTHHRDVDPVHQR